MLIKFKAVVTPVMTALMVLALSFGSFAIAGTTEYTDMMMVDAESDQPQDGATDDAADDAYSHDDNEAENADDGQDTADADSTKDDNDVDHENDADDKKDGSDNE